MGEPFGTIAAAAGLADVCIRLVVYVRQVRRDGATIRGELEALATEIENLRSLCEVVQKTLGDLASHDHDKPMLLGTAEMMATASELWVHIGRTISNCREAVQKLHTLLVEICGGDPEAQDAPQPTAHGASRCIDVWKKVKRKMSREGDLTKAREQLASHQSGLNLLLSVIEALDRKSTRATNSRSFASLSKDIAALEQKLGSQISDLKHGSTADNAQLDATPMAALKELRASVKSASLAFSSQLTNKYFDIPQSVSSYYVGRQGLLRQLRGAFIQPPGSAHGERQRRFVVQGISGSGKTQFCCKFADENRDSFWGVFYIDGSSETHLQLAMGKIGRLAGLGSNAAAAMHWLSTAQRPWLLIIDNADDGSIDLEKYFPRGKRGHILITTHVPGFRIYGNIEPAFYDFGCQALSPEDATDLLLRTSMKPSPWKAAWRKVAMAITESLGFLALAICHAGAAIRNGLCTLTDFDEFYNLSWLRIRDSKTTAGKCLGGEHEVCAIATWEMLYNELERKDTEAAGDAIQLLKIFAFLHWENIPRELLTRALRNAPLEAEQEEKERQQAGAVSGWKPASWTEWLLAKRRKLLVFFFFVSQGPSPLPGVMRYGRQPGNLNAAELRVRYALKELAQRSLILQNDHNNSFTMHTIVHRWAHLRPGMGLGEQSLWADMAGMVLAASILLPPLGLNTQDEMYHLSLLPHAEHVLNCRRSFGEQMNGLQPLARTSWLKLGRTVYEEKLRMLAKFGYIFARSGRFADAEEMLAQVRDALCDLLGPHHARTRRVTLALSDIYWAMGRSEDASALQRSVLRACEDHLGRAHPDTLRAMGKLGHTFWQQGHYTDALALQREAVQGLQRRLGRNHPDALEATDQLGRTVTKFYRKHDIEESYELHRTAVEGMEEVHGRDHPRTLDAKENLSRVALLRGHDGDVEFAEELITEVLEERRIKLGRENPYTLLTMVNMAITKCAVRKPRDGEAMVRAALAVADRTYGSDHIATLWGRSVLGVTLVHQSRYREAEEVLARVAGTQKSMEARRGGYHPDRLATLIELARCYQLQGKTRQSIQVCEEVLQGFRDISRPDAVHPLAEQLRAAREAMAGHLEADISGASEDPWAPLVSFPAIHFHVSR